MLPFFKTKYNYHVRRKTERATIDDLLKLLAVSQRDFALSRLYRQGADVIEPNKNQLKKSTKGYRR